MAEMPPAGTRVPLDGPVTWGSPLTFLKLGGAGNKRTHCVRASAESQDGHQGAKSPVRRSRKSGRLVISEAARLGQYDRGIPCHPTDGGTPMSRRSNLL